MLRSLSCLLAGLAVGTSSAGSVTFADSSSSVQQVAGTVQAQGSDSSSAESAVVGSSSGTDSSHVMYSIRDGTTTSKGVNLGSWLVAEHWMTSTADFWTGVSEDDAGHGEYTAIANATDPDTIRSHFDYHHATFINESDIADIAAVGINPVRVPIGYWIVGFDHNDPSGKAEWEMYTNGTLQYLDLLVTDWAKKYNVAVLLSIHAAKGSQNGADNSSPSVYDSEFWAAYAENVNNTISMVEYLAARYKDEDAFLGFGLMNEPNGATTTDVLYDYYERAYAAVRATGSECVLSVAPLLSSQSPDVLTDFMLAPAYTNVWVEWHPYFVWGYDDVSDEDLVSTSVKVTFQGDVTQWNSISGHNRLFLGEWCFATNGKFEDDEALFYEFAAAQTAVANQAEGGWTYWSWRIYDDETGDNMWSLRAVLRDEKLKEILFPSGRGSSSTIAASSSSDQESTTTGSSSSTDQTQQQTTSSTSTDQTQQQATTTTSSSTSVDQTQQQQSRKL
jgi:glucan 1,3-beta-glucosidase